MKKSLFIATVISFCITAFASNASALTQQEFFDQLEAIFKNCSSGKITIEQWKEQHSQLNNQALKEGIINQQTYDLLTQSRENDERAIQYNRAAEQLLQSCKRSEITLDDYQSRQAAALKGMFDGGFITQDQYLESQNKLTEYVKECDESQKKVQAQMNAQENTPQSPTPEQIARIQAEQEKIIQQLNEISTNCQNNKLSPDELETQFKSILSDALQKNTFSQDDIDSVSEQIPVTKAQCAATQEFLKNLETCAQTHGPTQQYRLCAEAEMDKLILSGFATQNNKAEFMQNLDAKLAEMAVLNKPNSGHELNPNRNSLLPDYQEKLNKVTYTAYNGLYDENAYYDRAVEILNDADHQDLLTKSEYDLTLNAIQNYKSYLESLSHIWVGDYELLDYSCSGNTCTSTHQKVGEHVESRIIRHREGFEITVGINGGVIWDEAWKKAPVTYDSLHTDEFWSARNFDGIDKLGMAGFYLSVEYIFFGFLGFYIQQEFDAGKWLGDAGKFMDFTQILGMTFFGVRFIAPFWASRFQLGFNFGLGMAYSNGDKREYYILDNYIHPYIFDDSLNKGVAFAAKAGVSFDFFITPEFAFGLKLDYNFVYNEMSDSIYDRNFGYEDINVGHHMHFLQPGIQITWTFPTSAFYSSYRGDTLTDPIYFKDKSPYPAPFDSK